MERIYKVSIVIPTLNEEVRLPILLKVLKNQSYQNFEVIVSDAYSKDKTREVAREFNTKIVDGGSISVGRNNGAKVAEGNILIFMDADIYFNRDFLKDSLDEFTKKNYDVAITKFDGKGVSAASRLLYKLSDIVKTITKNRKMKFGTSQCLFIKTEAFRLVNGFNENLLIGEDIDFMQRISKARLKYGILNTKINASDRRFVKIGIFRVLVGSAMVVLMLSLGLYNRKKIQKFVEKIYGGWGNLK
ncbi:glycosyltransferase [Candidatus Dojkabacteria bacterium]|uniref:Glycosyltransferase n=1 Tax=Candidatus Dojkabacteria bacterium TaxID=2099670 RepID=A0A3M0Z0R2_9BACT|nr:MAG: glycosyltransferase [Candidatus Dojkabacteria bacterium]